MGDEPDEGVWAGWVVEVGSRVGDGEIGFAAAGGRCGGEEAHGFFDDGGGVGEFVEEVGFFGDERCGLGRIGS